jgi:hypothetical protein
LLHRHGYLKLASWSGGSFSGNAQEESRKINVERAKVDADIDVDSIEKFTDKLPHLIDVDPTLEKQHHLISPELYSRYLFSYD